MSIIKLKNYKLICLKEKEYYVLTSDMEHIAVGDFHHNDAKIIYTRNSDELSIVKLQIGVLQIHLDFLEAEIINENFGFEIENLDDEFM